MKDTFHSSLKDMHCIMKADMVISMGSWCSSKIFILHQRICILISYIRKQGHKWKSFSFRYFCLSGIFLEVIHHSQGIGSRFFGPTSLARSWGLGSLADHMLSRLGEFSWKLSKVSLQNLAAPAKSGQTHAKVSRKNSLEVVKGLPAGLWLLLQNCQISKA